MKRRLFILAGAVLTTGCATGLTLDPAFVPRAQEWAMSVPAGTLPPSHLSLGKYEVTDVAVEQQPELVLGLGPVETQIGGNWRLRARVGGPEAGKIACIGPSDPWKSPDKLVHISVGRARLGCRLEAGGKPWTMLFDVELNSSGPDVPEWVTALQAAQGSDAKADPRDWDAVVVDDEGRAFSVEWAHQTVRVGNVGGYYAYVDGQIMGAIDVTYLGAPKAYVAKDAPAEMVPIVVTSMATAYLIVSLR